MARAILGARLAGAGILAAGGTGTVAVSWVQQELGEDALSRTLSFYKVALPALIEYKSLEWRNLPEKESNERFDELHIKWAPRFRDKYLELRGFYLKQGQAIATNISDLAPKIWQDTMEPLLDRVPPVAFSRIEQIIDDEIGLAQFDYIEKEPLGSASIGQVHRAIWRSPIDGEKKSCVIKIMYPEVEKSFRADVYAVKRICKEMFPQYYIAFEEIEKQFQSEFDYTQEAANALTIRNNLLASSYRNDFIVPQVYKATKRILIMEEIQNSIQLTQSLRDAARAEVSRRGLSDVNALLKLEEKREIDAAASGKVLQNSIFSRWLSSLLARIFGTFPIEPNRLIDRLLLVHGHQILIDGCFSSDPHPGNLLLSRDSNKIALIDFGQAKKLDKSTRIQLAKLVLLVDAAIKTDPRTSAKNNNSAISSKHRIARQAVAQAMTQAGFRTKTNDVDCLYELASVYFGRDDRVWIWPRNFQQWTEYMESRDPVVDLADCEHFVMVVRCGMLIRGLGHLLHEHRNLASVWTPIATQVLRNEGQLEDLQDQLREFSVCNSC
uniref:Protein kinase domain-containing protein n=1 Tax=Aureoumbra lagunensis TaxID=44058 RepID=A0A7S3K415_9STRA|mmetsp:Transcript_8470/g.12956  ORF Transcript_8470/g.12956 Transcript_8470/m.12956 type:complete len:552 (-) Transcript_8470:53-1708(-)|eukprot:CAMPEP_0197310394 /NCGR_PEP_ID=MMETSP0891-20130614/8981_1 /TAXON_ID=44058 ORGANISM="Aureoumbra lagunensis, Strain CCMP1510" /NCGR_SAMPLE_ID=MMETSP0891 /ASSEMBLY_ACC=CAM_ASM_000534 /LENGTH=551 /DNA_ID=CAMNT_0042796015 /DNA_START=1988 /DNA_END=3643 /DNA_ORIENTATION=+